MIGSQNHSNQLEENEKEIKEIKSVKKQCWWIFRGKTERKKKRKKKRREREREREGNETMLMDLFLHKQDLYSYIR